VVFWQYAKLENIFKGDNLQKNENGFEFYFLIVAFKLLMTSKQYRLCMYNIICFTLNILWSCLNTFPNPNDYLYVITYT